MDANTSQSIETSSDKGKEILDHLVETLNDLVDEDDKKRARSVRKLSKYAIGDLEILLNHLQFKIEDLNKRLVNNYGENWRHRIRDDRVFREEIDTVTDVYFTWEIQEGGLKEYLQDRNKKEELEQRLKIEAKLRKKQLEQKILEDLKNEGITDVSEYQKIHWTEFSSPCKKNPQSAMVLNPDGMIDRQTATKECLKGQSKGVLKNLEVTYDKDYVVAWLKVKVVSNLQELPLEVIQALIKEAYNKLND